MVGLLLGSGPLAFESVLLCTFRRFSALSVAFGTLKVIETFPDAGKGHLQDESLGVGRG